jgi:hypothetical protein
MNDVIEVYVLVVGEVVEKVFKKDINLVKDFFETSYEIDDIDCDELEKCGETYYTFSRFQGLEKITLTPLTLEL